MKVADVLMEIAGQSPDLMAVAKAATQDESGKAKVLADALFAHLCRVHNAPSGTGDDVYTDPSAFQSFIDHGGNPALYEQTMLHLQREHQKASPGRVLDIGCGDGRVTATVLSLATTAVTLVEPSNALLTQAKSRVASSEGRDGPRTTHALNASIVEVLEEDRARTLEWDFVQSTYAMHTLPHRHRPTVFEELAKRTKRFAMVDFDVAPACAIDHDRTRVHAEFAADRYAAGVAEYAEHPEVVSGFLMPVLWSQFAPGRDRQTFEQPAEDWAKEIRAGGFTSVEVQPVHSYWWSPAVLITAVGRGAADACG